MQDLTLVYGRSRVPIVEGVSFRVERGETLALVGESGCGKSLSALALLRLLPPGIEVLSGQVLFEGEDLLRLDEDRLRLYRGGRVAMIFQDPMTALNPVLTVGAQITEVLTLHRGLSGREARQEAARLLREVGIPAAEERLASYPHELSGGMRQRAMIAMALAGEPELLVADEPTTALDVTVQAQILSLLDELRRRRGLSVLLISHDLGVVAALADRVGVMYAGRLVEEAPVERIFKSPLHPYTRALMDALPRLEGESLRAIPGRVPPPGRRPQGCKFSDRCPLAGDDCRAGEPPLAEREPGHRVRCLR